MVLEKQLAVAMGTVFVSRVKLLRTRPRSQVKLKRDVVF